MTRSWASGARAVTLAALACATCVAVRPAMAMEPRVAAPERSNMMGDDPVFRQRIERRPDEEWPFTVDRGYLICLRFDALAPGEKVTWFEELDGGRSIPLHTNPFVIAFADEAERSLLRAYPTPVEGYAARAPFTALARALCDEGA